MGKITLVRFYSLSLVGILLIAGFLRLYRISDRLTFLGDEGRDVLVVRDILLGRNFPLIGPGTSVGNMYLGPLYYYLISPSLLASGFSPVGPAILVAVIGVLTVGLVWLLSREWVDSPVALVITLAYAVSPVVITYSHSSWNPNVMPFFSLLCIYSIWKVWHNSDWRWLLITAVSFAFVLNSHYLGILLVPVLGLVWHFSQKNLHALRYTLIAVFVFGILMSPLLFFDLRHNGINFNAFKTFVTNRQQTVNLKAYKAVPNLWPIWVDLNTTLLSPENIQIGTAMSVILILGLLFTLTKFKSAPEILIVLFWIFFGILGLGLYKQHIYAHYYGFLYPAPFLLFGLIIQNIPKLMKIPVISALFIAIIYSFIHSPVLSAPNMQMSRTETVAKFIIDQSGNRPFNLALLSNHNYDASYRYFLAVNNSRYIPVDQKITDQLYVICEKPDPGIPCQPINNPLYEIAAFGWSKIDNQWPFPWQVEVYKLVHNSQGT